jgi:hypothetical protein
MRRLIVFLFTAVLAACAVPHSASDVPFSPASRPTDGRALFYVFRVDEATGPFNAHSVRIDGKPVLSLQMPDYTVVYLSPGTHTVTVDKGSLDSPPAARDFTFEVEANEVSALGLDYVGPVQERPQIGFVPGTRTPTAREYYWTWDRIRYIETTPHMYVLKKRWFRRAATPELAIP